MAASQADFDALLETLGYVDEQWPEMARILKAVAGLWHAMTSTGTDPDNHLTYFNFGDASDYLKVRIGFDGTNIVFETNSGDDDTPSWDELLRINVSTDAATFAGAVAIGGALTGVTSLTLSGDLALGGNNITNVGTITCTTVNGVDPSSHAARHVPGGADEIAVASTILDVGSTASAGSSADLARGNHVHRGVASIKVDGGALGYGAFEFIDGNETSAEIAAGQIQFDYDPPWYLYTEEAGDLPIGVATEVDFTEITALAITPADGAIKFRVDATVVFYAAAGTEVQLRMFVGTNGNLLDTTPEATVFGYCTAAGYCTLSISGYEITPAAADKIGLVGYSTLATTVIASGQTTPSLAVTEVQTAA